ncbi:MAG TPA: hypothetical protein VFV46_13040 [Lacibacter sp.]|nr:hypothetical protein [Lacibacter sp.]
MKFHFLFLGLLLQFANVVVAQKATFNIQYSEKLAVYYFVKNITAKYGTHPFKTEFQKSIYNEKKYLDLLAHFDNIKTDYLYSFAAFPYGVKLPMITETALQKHLIASASLQDFKIRAMGLITNEDLTRLTDILAAFTPIYNELIYKSHQNKFNAQLKALSDFVHNQQTAHLFEQGLQFYQSVWDKSIPFELVFYPLPTEEGFSAGAFYNYLISAFPTDYDDEEDFTVLLGVMMHESFHILFDEQPLQVKQNIETYFRQNPSVCSQYAYMLLNEVLATATGNGFVYEQIRGKEYKEDWYFISYVNQMAKKIYPTVQTYLKENKAIDKAFIDTYIQVYEQNFKQWLHEPAHIFTYRYILSSNQADVGTISQFFPFCSAMETDDNINVNSLEKMKNTPLTKIIIVSKDHAKQLALIKGNFPELKTWKYDAGKEFTHTVFLSDKTQLYIFNQLQTPVEKWLNGLQSDK